MPRKVRVTTASFASPLVRGPLKVDITRAFAARCVDAAGAEGADLVCLPETLQYTGRPEPSEGETIPGPTFDLLAERARANRVNVVAGLVERQGEQNANVAVVIDRDGRLVGRYAKIHPTIKEVQVKCFTPGGEPVVVDLDVGRVGLAICYDIGWPHVWRDLADRGAEVVVWPSAYDGGFPLQVYAWSHFYYVISSVWGEHSKVIDITGRVLASTSHWSHLTSATIDLEKEVFHVDGQTGKLLDIQTRYGARVTAVGLSEENVFTLESNDPTLPLAEIKREFGLENFREYHARATQVQDDARAAIQTLDSAASLAGRR